MKPSFELFSFFTILKESIKLITKNGKLMALLALFYIILSSSSFLLFNHFLQTSIDDISVTVMKGFMPDPTAFQVPDPTADPSSFTPNLGFDPAQLTAQLNHLKQDAAFLLAAEIGFLLACYIFSFCGSLAATLVSAMSYNTKTISLQDLFPMIGRTFTRTLITSFYVIALGIGYFVVFMTLNSPFMILFPNHAAISIAVLLAVIACVFYLYLFVTWGLALVVSVVEENFSGTSALAKATELGKGKRIHGFFLNVFFNIIALVIFQVYKMLLGNNGLMNSTLYGLFMLNTFSLLKIFISVTYTALYFECKKQHGEEIELHGSIQYAKLSATTQLVHETA